MTMQLTSTTAQHSMEHSMSAYHHNLPHGAGLIMISKAFAEFFMERHACDAQFVKMARAMGMEHADKPQDFLTALVALQEACGVAQKHDWRAFWGAPAAARKRPAKKSGGHHAYFGIERKSSSQRQYEANG